MASVHVQPVPAIAVAVRPVGSVSTTETGAVVAPPPIFDAVIEYEAPICPCTKLPVCDLEMVMSGEPDGMVKVCDALSPPPGPGLNANTVAEPALATSEAGTVTVIEVEEHAVGVSRTPAN